MPIRSIFTLLLLGITTSVFAQVNNGGDVNSVPIQMNIVFQKDVLKPSPRRIYVKLRVQNNNSISQWCILSHNGISTLDADKMEMYQPCSKHGCVTLYKFTGSNGFYVLKIPANSTFSLDSLVLDGYSKDDHPTSVHATFSDALVIGGSNFADNTMNDPVTDKQAVVAFSLKSKQYDKDLKVSFVSKNGPPSPIVVLSPIDKDITIEAMPPATNLPLHKAPGKTLKK